MLLIKGLFGGVFQIALFAVLLFVPAGTWHWQRAVQFLAVYGILILVSIIALARLAPASLEARLQKPAAKSQPRADKIVSFFLFLSIIVWFVFIPIDVFRLRLLPPPHLIVSVCGAVLFFAGFGIILTALFQNAFAAPIVKDQSERGQVLIDTGLYGCIRHPFYLGNFPFFIGLGLWLESYAGVLVLPLVFGFLIARTFVEEKTLQETLPGYVEYMAKVRYRLIPFIW
ncbi:methyltransferase family protein [candidate division KSB1 bacterium]